MDKPQSLMLLCIQRLASNLIKYGPKKVRFGRLSKLPGRALEALLDILIARNALNDNVLPHALTRQTQRLGLEGAAQLRRCVLNTIGRSCPQLQILDVRSCHQVDNRIVRDVLQYCERLECLRLDGCLRISDSAFAPALWKPPLAGLLGLRELSVGKCGQITNEGLMGYVVKGAPSLRALGVAYDKICITDDVAAELLCSFGLEVLDISFCTQVTDAPFRAEQPSTLRELRLANTTISDAAIEGIARRAANLELVDVGWVMKLTDRSVQALVDGCRSLRSLCVCNTQITDESFRAIARCSNLERLDASWCLRATPAALDILAASEARPPLRELLLDSLGALELGFGIDCLGGLPPPASPGLGHVTGQAKGSWGTSSPWLGFALEPPCLALPPPVASPGMSPARPSFLGPGGRAKVGSPALTSMGVVEAATRAAAAAASARSATSEALDVAPEGASGAVQLLPPPAVPVGGAEPVAPPASLRLLVSAYARTLSQLLLDGVRDVATPTGLEVIATCCPELRQLALTFPKPDPSPPALKARQSGTEGAALEQSLHKIGASCYNLNLLRLDCSSRPHKAVVAALALPSFPQLRQLTLVCCTKDSGLLDSELEQLLSGRTALEALALRNCEGLSEGLFPRWCNRKERYDEYIDDAAQELDQAIFASLGPGFGVGAPLASPSCSSPLLAPAPAVAEPKARRRRQLPRCPAAQALRTITAFSLGGATSLTDRAADALAEILHDAQTVELRGCPLLTEESVRSFRKGCKFIRSMAVVTRERTLSWTAATSSVKKHHHRRSQQFSASSGTESN